MLAAFAGLYGVAMILYSLAVQTFDRYLWPLALPLAVLLLWQSPASPVPVAAGDGGPVRTRPAARRVPGPATWAAGVLLCAIGALSVAILLNAMAYDAARWRAGSDEEARGLPAMSIDAGIEWPGSHTTEVADQAVPLPHGRTRYSRLWTAIASAS